MNPLEHMAKVMDIGYALGAGLPVRKESDRTKALRDKRVVPAIMDQCRAKIEQYHWDHGQYPDVGTFEQMYIDAYSEYWTAEEESAREDVRRVRGME